MKCYVESTDDDDASLNPGTLMKWCYCTKIVSGVDGVEQTEQLLMLTRLLKVIFRVVQKLWVGYLGKTAVICYALCTNHFHPSQTGIYVSNTFQLNWWLTDGHASGFNGAGGVIVSRDRRRLSTAACPASCHVVAHSSFMSSRRGHVSLTTE